MTLEEACTVARRRRDLYNMDVHVFRYAMGEFYTVLKINLPIFLSSIFNSDKTIYYTAWKLKK